MLHIPVVWLGVHKTQELRRQELVERVGSPGGNRIFRSTFFRLFGSSGTPQSPHHGPVHAMRTNLCRRRVGSGSVCAAQLTVESDHVLVCA